MAHGVQQFFGLVAEFIKNLALERLFLRTDVTVHHKAGLVELLGRFLFCDGIINLRA